MSLDAQPSICNLLAQCKDPVELKWVGQPRAVRGSGSDELN
ncbi:hypothetical protein RIB2604_00402490 [Aspergillus luchuensis]|uniref:Uncharacterized protein n=1 Tax=Aspergillus kawachii TaxID=1069201 RepID=A0A146F0E3_ASPKA|nr:hypothetical protein RIB2604_00402490 [Aspergillus luchuensis]